MAQRETGEKEAMLVGGSCGMAVVAALRASLERHEPSSAVTVAATDPRAIVNEREVKPAQMVKVGDVVRVKQNPIYRSYTVKEVLTRRVGAKLVDQYIAESTPQSELEKLEMMKLMPGFDRERGAGRPTKKERRDIDKLRF